MPRFFLPPSDLQGTHFILKGDEAHHALSVFRKKAGDELDLFDGQDSVFRGRIEHVIYGEIHGQILERQDDAAPSGPTVYVLAGVIKGPRWDWLVQKACEVGADELIPLLAERSVVKIDAADASEKQKRWQRISLEAAKQCGRVRAMAIAQPASLAAALSRLPAGVRILMPWEKETSLHIREALKKRSQDDATALLIGPEGGWSKQEVELAQSKGAVPVTLGANLLRSETAAITAVVLARDSMGCL